MRTLPVLIIAAGLIASLTSCSPGDSVQACDTSVVSGDASSVVTATGPFGSAPKIAFPTPLVTKKLQSTQLLAGSGEPLQSGQTALIKFSVLDGVTGDVLQQGDYSRATASVTIGGSAIAAVSQGLKCATLGSRVAIVSSAKDVGQTGAGASTDAVVFVIDVDQVFPARASGSPQIAQSGMPSVVTAPDGTPGIVIPKQDAPQTLTVNDLIKGDGAVLKADDQVLVKYTGFVWGDSSVFNSTWTKGDATFMRLTASDTVTAGLVKGLVGQKVGSQVLIVAPPKDGYGDTGSSGVPAGSTLVYVVDVLGVVK